MKKIFLLFRENKFIFPVAIALLALSVSIFWFNPLNDYSEFLPSITIFVIVNINLALLLMLLFIVGRNLIKLIFERRRGVFGSKLRAKLVMTFVSLLLFPTIIIFTLASGLLGQALQGWFGNHMDQLSDGASEMSQLYFQQEKNQILTIAKRIENRMIAGEDLGGSLKKIRQQANLFSIKIYAPDNSLIQNVQHTIAEMADFTTPDVDQKLINVSRLGDYQIEAPESGETRFIRIYYSANKFVIVLDKRIEPELSLAINKVSVAYREYQERKTFKGPIKSSYLLILALVTALILLAAIWVAIYIAKELTNPIKRLSQAMNQVAYGNYEVKVSINSNDEVASLVNSFNIMTQDLKESKIIADKSREQIEAVISKIAIGIMIVDYNNNIKFLNGSFQSILQIDNFDGSLKSILNNVSDEIKELFISTDEAIDGKYFALKANNSELKVVITKLRLKSNEFLILVDDVSGLQRTQMALAWQEVAKRVAHEIRNPLTPIQLNAERIISDQLSEMELKKLAANIIENVDSIKRLSKEFSRVASLPGIKIELCDLKLMLERLVEDYSKQFTDINFRIFYNNQIQEIPCDPEQIRRVFINILDNATHAVSESLKKKISVRLEIIDEYLNVEISDTGTGFNKSEQELFSSGYSSKINGSGLGLSIVKEIIEQHRGSVQLGKSEPSGALVRIKLPIHSLIKQRKLSAV